MKVKSRTKNTAREIFKNCSDAWRKKFSYVEMPEKSIKIIHVKHGKLRRQLFVSKHDAAKGPVVPVCKEAVTRQTASRWINVKAHDPNKRIISEIYCAASRVVNFA